ncbi:MAG: cytochrome c oxidase subunit II [Gemmatimonadales bacterium]
MRRQTGEIVALVILFLSITVFTVVGFTRDWAPTVASEHGVGVDSVIDYLLLATGAVLVVGTVVFVFFLWQYGRGGRALSPRTSARTERWWTLVPVLGMALLAEAGVLLKGLPVWEQVYGETPEDVLVVEVVAQQFEWIARYPGPDGVFGRTAPELVHQTVNPAGLDPADPTGGDDIITRNRLYLPVDRTVVVRLRSRDVLHSFSVPAFRVKQDVVPGMIIQTQFKPTVIGEYEIACAELCGMGHYRMGGTVFVRPQAAFDAWLDEQAGGDDG